ncbi:hypothetical protein FRC17_001257 [Serendipita sp. 399]|nr:hypothetical protein FRC17_001257 [Serendipita sp. 399]
MELMDDSSEEEVSIEYQNYLRTRRGELPVAGGSANKGKQRATSPCISIRDSTPIAYDIGSDAASERKTEKDDIVYNLTDEEEPTMAQQSFLGRSTSPNNRFSSPQETIVLSSPIYPRRRGWFSNLHHQTQSNLFPSVSLEIKPPKREKPRESSWIMAYFDSQSSGKRRPVNNFRSPSSLKAKESSSSATHEARWTPRHPSTSGTSHASSRKILADSRQNETVPQKSSNVEESSWKPPPRPHRHRKWDPRHPLLDDPRAPRARYINDHFNAPARAIKISDGSHLYVERSKLNTISRTRMQVVARGSAMNSTKARAFYSDRSIILKPPLRINIAEISASESDDGTSADEPGFPDRDILDKDSMQDNAKASLFPEPMEIASISPRSARKSVGAESLCDPDSLEESDSPSDSDSVQEITQPSSSAKRRSPSPQNPPPPEILGCIRQMASSCLAKTPFLRRNLRLSFDQAFFAHLRQQRALPLNIPQYTEFIYPVIYWEYRLEERGHPVHKWRCKQPGWLCQLCPCFPPFALGSALIYHIQRDHTEVEVSRRKLGKRLWRLRIQLAAKPSTSDDPETISLPTTHDPIIELSPPSHETVDSFDSTEPRPGFEKVPNISRGQKFVETDERGAITHLKPRILRYGGYRAYDLAIQRMPLPLLGFNTEAQLAKEEDTIGYIQSRDEDKALAIMWGRWILQKE